MICTGIEDASSVFYLPVYKYTHKLTGLVGLVDNSGDFLLGGDGDLFFGDGERDLE